MDRLSPPVGEILEWDSSHFGIKIGIIRPRVVTAEEMVTVLKWAEEQAVRCLYWLSDSAEQRCLALGFANAFRFVDLRLEFSIERRQHQLLDFKHGYLIRDAYTKDVPALLSIGKDAYSDSRFAKDSGFPAERIESLYAEWVLKGVQNRAVIVACNGENQPLGYLNWKSEEAGFVGRLSLLGVSEFARGKGVGRALVQDAITRLFESGHQEIRVVTQGSNVAAQRLYQSFGFRTLNADVWFHRWFD